MAERKPQQTNLRSLPQKRAQTRPSFKLFIIYYLAGPNYERSKTYCRSKPNCAFSNDTVLIASTHSDLQHNLGLRSKALLKYNLEINIEKTKVLIISKVPTTTNISLINIPIEQVDSFKYLGSWIEKRRLLDKRARPKWKLTKELNQQQTFFGTLT